MAKPSKSERVRRRKMRAILAAAQARIVGADAEAARQGVAGANGQPLMMAALQRRDGVGVEDASLQGIGVEGTFVMVAFQRRDDVGVEGVGVGAVGAEGVGLGAFGAEDVDMDGGGENLPLEAEAARAQPRMRTASEQSFFDLQSDLAVCIDYTFDLLWLSPAYLGPWGLALRRRDYVLPPCICARCAANRARITRAWELGLYRNLGELTARPGLLQHFDSAARRRCALVTQVPWQQLPQQQLVELHQRQQQLIIEHSAIRREQSALQREHEQVAQLPQHGAHQARPPPYEPEQAQRAVDAGPVAQQPVVGNADQQHEDPAWRHAYHAAAQQHFAYHAAAQQHFAYHAAQQRFNGHGQQQRFGVYLAQPPVWPQMAYAPAALQEPQLLEMPLRLAQLLRDEGLLLPMAL